MNADVNLIIEDLQRQIASLAKEKAIYYALAVQKEHELKKVKQELEELKNNEEKGDEE